MSTRLRNRLRALSSILLCGLTLLLAKPAQAEVLISIDLANCNPAGIDYSIAQSFRVDSTVALEKIEIWIGPTLTPTSYALDLFNDEGPGGTPMATSPTQVSMGTSTEGVVGGWHSFFFTNMGIVLQPGQAYTFLLRRTSQNGGRYYWCYDPYPDGFSFRNGYIRDLTLDIAFKLHGAVMTPWFWALQFSSAARSYVNIPYVPIASDFTLEAWIRPSSAGADQIILAREAGCQQQSQFRLFLDANNRLAFVMTDGSGADGGLWSSINDYRLRSSSALPLNAWSHVAVTKSGTAFALYINGTLEAAYTASQNLLPSGIHPFRIGARVGCGSTPADLTFNGAIDEVRVWGTTRSQAQIAATMNQILLPWDPSISEWEQLTAYYRLNEGTGSVTGDFKTSAEGTLMNGPEWVPH